MDLLINTYGTRIRSRGERIALTFPNNSETKEYPARRLEKIIILRPSSISTGAVQLALEHDIDIVYLGAFGKPVGRIFPSHPKGLAQLRRAQLAFASTPGSLSLAKRFVQGKSENQIAYLRQLQALYAADFSHEILEAETLLKPLALIPDTSPGKAQLFGVEEGSLGHLQNARRHAHFFGFVFGGDHAGFAARMLVEMFQLVLGNRLSPVHVARGGRVIRFLRRFRHGPRRWTPLGKRSPDWHEVSLFQRLAIAEDITEVTAYLHGRLFRKSRSGPVHDFAARNAVRFKNQAMLGVYAGDKDRTYAIAGLCELLDRPRFLSVPADPFDGFTCHDLAFAASDPTHEWATRFAEATCGASGLRLRRHLVRCALAYYHNAEWVRFVQTEGLRQLRVQQHDRARAQWLVLANWILEAREIEKERAGAAGCSALKPDDAALLKDLHRYFA